MKEKVLTLDNGQLQVRILLPGWGYDRSRYDHGGTVEQVTYKGHSYLSKELDASGGVGLGGVGLTNVYEWRDSELYDSTAIADYFPMLGVGLLKKTDTSPFLFTRDYPTVPYEHSIEVGENSISIRSLPHLCNGIAADITKTYTLDKNSLIVGFNIRNVGSRAIHATEFCHNFFQFDDYEICSDYRMSFPYSIEASLRRGQLIMERDAYRLGDFDEATQSTAFWIRGWEGMKTHWMKLENRKLSMSVLIEDDFELCNFYSWNNRKAFCPEVFAPIGLESGQEQYYERKYSFFAE